MYAQVVVLTYQAPDIDSFTYQIPKELEKQIKIGQLVEVPFGKRNPIGVVISLHPEIRNSKFEIRNLKQIADLAFKPTLLLPYQVNLLLWMSAYYIAPMVNCLEAMLPEIPARVAQQEGLPTARRESININNTSNITSRALAGGKVVTGPSQTLILVPTINRIPETLAKFPKAKSPAVYHNELKSKERFEIWLKIKNGNFDFIFGSRSAIFTPCPNLKEIIIYDEHDGAYKDDRSPYFDTLTVAQKISQLCRAQIKIVDPAPKITTYHEIPNHIKIQKFKQKVTVVDMQNEKMSGRKSAISYMLEDEIKNRIDKKQNVLLFLNKKKQSGHLFCRDCKTSHYLEKEPVECPNCKSQNFFWNVLNVNSMKSEIKNLFPKIPVNIIAEGISPSSLDFSHAIDISTAFSLYQLKAKKYDLVAHIRFDTLLGVASFNSSEKAYSQAIELKKLLNDRGQLLLQTYNPENQIISAIEKDNYKSFYEYEINTRRLLAYPPYALLIKLTIKGKDQSKVKKQADLLFSQLSATNDEQLTFLGPYKPIFMKKQPTYHIIAKYKIESFSLKKKEESMNQITRILEKGSKNYTIEVEPDSIQ